MKTANLKEHKQKLIDLLHLSKMDVDLFVFPSHLEALLQLHLHTIATISLQTGKMHVASFGPLIEKSLRLLQPFELEVHRVCVDQNLMISQSLLTKALSIRTALFSMEGIDELGVGQDIALLGKSCQETNVSFHVDISRAIGLLEVIDGLDFADYITFGFESNGVVIAKKETNFKPMSEEIKKINFDSLFEKMQKANSHYMELASKKTRMIDQITIDPIQVLDLPNLPTHFCVQLPTIHGDIVCRELQSSGYRAQIINKKDIDSLDPLVMHSAVSIQVTDHIDPEKLQKELMEIYDHYHLLSKQLLANEEVTL